MKTTVTFTLTLAEAVELESVLRAAAHNARIAESADKRLGLDVCAANRRIDEARALAAKAVFSAAFSAAETHTDA